MTLACKRCGHRFADHLVTKPKCKVKGCACLRFVTPDEYLNEEKG